MLFLKSLGVGDLFRVAHPSQTSLNKRKMPRDHTFKITKVYPMAPYVAISVRLGMGPEDGFYSLGPKTPVLYPKEVNPSEASILKFLGVKYRKKPIGYRLNWDGKIDISKQVTPQAYAILKMMLALGQKEYSAQEIHEACNTQYARFLGYSPSCVGYYYFKFYRRLLVSKGLIDEIVDDRPIPPAVAEANLQETFHED
jgi:hypothetical protein